MTTQIPRIVIVSQHFAPSTGATAQLVTDLADSFFEQGLSPLVITSTPSKVNSNYPVIRTTVVDSHSSRNSIFFKSLSGLSFFLQVLTWSITHLDSTRDRLLIYSNPPFIGFLGVCLRLLRGIDYTYVHQDLFPRSAVISGVIPQKGPLTFLLQNFFKLVDLYAKNIIFLSESMRSRHLSTISPFHKKSVVIPNWAIERALPLPKQSNQFAIDNQLVDTLVIQYSGNYGRMHDMLTLLEAARLLQDQPISFLFVGGGNKHSQIVTYKEYYQLSNVHLLPYQPRHILPFSLASSDLSAITLCLSAEDTVAPSKLYGILASAKPVLLVASSHSEIGKLIIDNNCGIVIEPGAIHDLVQKLKLLSRSPQLLQEMSHNSLETYKRLYGKDRSIALYKSALSSNLLS